MDKLKATKEQWDAEADASPNGPDETDALLQSDRNGYRARKGLWASPEEREKYLETPLNDEFIPPLFSENEEELEKSGLKDAITKESFPERICWNSRRKEISW